MSVASELIQVVDSSHSLSNRAAPFFFKEGITFPVTVNRSVYCCPGSSRSPETCKLL